MTRLITRFSSCTNFSGRPQKWSPPILLRLSRNIKNPTGEFRTASFLCLPFQALTFAVSKPWMLRYAQVRKKQQQPSSLWMEPLSRTSCSRRRYARDRPATLVMKGRGWQKYPVQEDTLFIRVSWFSIFRRWSLLVGAILRCVIPIPFQRKQFWVVSGTFRCQVEPWPPGNLAAGMLCQRSNIDHSGSF